MAEEALDFGEGGAGVDEEGGVGVAQGVGQGSRWGVAPARRYQPATKRLKGACAPLRRRTKRESAGWTACRGTNRAAQGIEWLRKKS